MTGTPTYLPSRLFAGAGALLFTAFAVWIVFNLLTSERADLLFYGFFIVIIGMVAAMCWWFALQGHIAEGRALPGAPHDEGMSHPLVVLSGSHEPEDTFIKIRHRELWFWIDDTDMRSKRTFLSLVIFSTLAESADAAQTPLLTIPAG